MNSETLSWRIRREDPNLGSRHFPQTARICYAVRAMQEGEPDGQGCSSPATWRRSKRTISAVADRAEHCTALFAGPGGAYAQSAAPDPGSCP
jgi:hypothetical protein